jgi:hypothetical protein
MWRIAGKTAVETAVTPDRNAKNNVKIRRERKVSSISNIPFSLDSKSVISPRPETLPASSWKPSRDLMALI